MPTDPPAAPTWRTYSGNYGPLILWVLSYALTAILSATAAYLGLPAPPPVVVEVEVIPRRCALRPN